MSKTYSLINWKYNILKHITIPNRNINTSAQKVSGFIFSYPKRNIQLTNSYKSLYNQNRLRSTNLNKKSFSGSTCESTEDYNKHAITLVKKLFNSTKYTQYSLLKSFFWEYNFLIFSRTLQLYIRLQKPMPNRIPNEILGFLELYSEHLPSNVSLELLNRFSEKNYLSLESHVKILKGISSQIIHDCSVDSIRWWIYYISSYKLNNIIRNTSESNIIDEFPFYKHIQIIDDLHQRRSIHAIYDLLLLDSEVKIVDKNYEANNIVDLYDHSKECSTDTMNVVQSVLKDMNLKKYLYRLYCKSYSNQQKPPNLSDILNPTCKESEKYLIKQYFDLIAEISLAAKSCLKRIKISIDSDIEVLFYTIHIKNILEKIKEFLPSSFRNFGNKSDIDYLSCMNILINSTEKITSQNNLIETSKNIDSNMLNKRTNISTAYTDLDRSYENSQVTEDAILALRYNISNSFRKELLKISKTSSLKNLTDTDVLMLRHLADTLSIPITIDSRQLMDNRILKFIDLPDNETLYRLSIADNFLEKIKSKNRNDEGLAKRKLDSYRYEFDYRTIKDIVDIASIPIGKLIEFNYLKKRENYMNKGKKNNISETEYKRNIFIRMLSDSNKAKLLKLWNQRENIIHSTIHNPIELYQLLVLYGLIHAPEPLIYAVNSLIELDSSYVKKDETVMWDMFRSITGLAVLHCGLKTNKAISCLRESIVRKSIWSLNQRVKETFFSLKKSKVPKSILIDSDFLLDTAKILRYHINLIDITHSHRLAIKDFLDVAKTIPEVWNSTDTIFLRSSINYQTKSTLKYTPPLSQRLY